MLHVHVFGRTVGRKDFVIQTTYCAPQSCRSTARSEKDPVKFGEGGSVMAVWLCIGCPMLVGRRKAAISTMQEFFAQPCTTENTSGFIINTNPA